MDNSPSNFWPAVPTLPAAYCPQPPEFAERRATILEALELESIIAPSEWEFLKPNRRVRQLGKSPEETVRQLQLSFPDNELIATGVAYRSGDELKLSNVFGVAPASFGFRYREHRPVDVVSPRGVLSGAKREWARLAGEARGINDAQQYCIVTESDRDARAFQQLGLSVTAAWPLRRGTSTILSNCLGVRVPHRAYK